MIEYKQGNILQEETEALVNTVNCVGVMGRGVALQFKKAFPENFKAYAAACRRNAVVPGRMFVFETGQLTPPRYIINFPTKRHWRGKSRMEDIEVGLEDLVRVIQEKNIRSIALPPLGSGLGGLDWAQVRRRIENALKGLADVRVIVYEPLEEMHREKIAKSKKPPKMTPGRAAMVQLIDHYLRGLVEPYVTLLEIHKLLYFMQVAGEPLKLRYVPGIYGPYAENLRHVLHVMEGYYISGYADGGDAPGKPVELVPGAIQDAQEFLKKSVDTRQRVEKVVELVKGFETPLGLELLSTVHWVISHQDAKTDEEIIQKIYAWGPRKRQFTERQILLAKKILETRGWISNSNGERVKR
jgi:O-acetyl-ADP-ribose deacetylase (regulator of RNase III)